MTAESGGRLDWKPWAALAAALLLYLLTQVLPLVGTDGSGRFTSHQNDFKHLYLGASLLVRGESPYDSRVLRETAALYQMEDPRFRTILPYVYLPFTGLVLSPLTAFRFSTAALIWQLVNHVLLIAGLVLAARAAGWPWSWKSVVLIAAAVVLNTAVFRQNNAGQLNAVLVFGYAVVYVGLRRSWHPAATGFAAAFLMLFKLSPGILLVLFLLTRRWREAAFMVGWSVLLLAGCVAVVGWEIHREFLPILQQMGYGESTWSHLGQTFWRDPFNQSPNAFFHRTLVPWEGYTPWLALGPGVANALTWGVTLAALGVFVWCGLALGPADGAWRAGALEVATSMAVAVSLLIPSILWDHYLVQLLVPCLLLWQVGHGRGLRVRRLLIASVIVLVSINLRMDNGLLGSRLANVGARLFDERQGLALALMSVKLIPVLAVAGLCIWVTGSVTQVPRRDVATRRDREGDEPAPSVNP